MADPDYDEDEHERNRDRREALDLVGCDDRTCEAKDKPETPDEWRAAAEHWRRHSYLHGCSHAR